MVGALLAVALLGALPQQISEVIQAREFQTIDESGEVRVAMSDTEQNRPGRCHTRPVRAPWRETRRCV